MFPRTPRTPRSQRGVALVITVVMLSVILFLTVAFLALMGREKGSVKTSIDQTTARLGAEAALERAKAELLAGIRASTNIYNYGLLVSTNYVNWNGFDPSSQGKVNFETNVNFDYQVGGAALTVGQFLANLTNLLYSPRVPVYIYNQVGATNEFRYYLDLNRNRRHDVSGLWPVLSADPVNRYLDTNGFVMAAPIFGNTLSNFVVGDPEWIGGLDRPDKSHGPENKYLFRYAYAAVPVGQTLDVNYLHNQVATRALSAANDGFFRNQGVAPWELNLAGFLVDLNTNIWNPVGNAYDYRLPATGFPNQGLAFEDALSILRYRYANNYNTLAFGYPLFLNNVVDEYSDGASLVSPTGLPVDTDVTVPWAGSDNPNHYFTMQDLFTKPAGGFTARLQDVSTNLSTYDQYTYYRMLQQLGTDSAPEDPDKLNLNYVNVGGLSATNFIRWTDTIEIQNRLGNTVNPALLFFTNAADKLLSRYTTEWLASDYRVYTNIFKTDQPFSITNIPVYVSNAFVYPAAVHRVLQVAANIWDTTSGTNQYPTVFRPRFRVDNGNVYISSFAVETTDTGVAVNTGNLPILDLHGATNAASLVPVDGNVLIFGVPLVIGAQKGLPNFNEFATESIFQITRKVELRKSVAGGADRITQTNQFFVLSLTMPTAAEFWNSYASNFNRPVNIYVTNRTTMSLTNDSGVVVNKTFVTGGLVSKGAPTYWPAANTPQTGFNDYNNPASFVVTMQTNIPFLPLTNYLPNIVGNAGFFSTNQNIYDTSQLLLAPRWGVTITNRVHAMIVEQGTRRILDYVLLGDLTSYRNLTEEISTQQSATLFDRLWATNASSLGGGRLSGRYGVGAQVQISRGFYNYPSEEWKNYGNFNTKTVASEIAKFRAFFDSSGEAGFDGKLGTNKSLQAIVPFSPSRQMSMPMIWAANDPLVHYISGELFHIAKSGKPLTMIPGSTVATNLGTIGAKNDRYLPWGKEPGAIQNDPDAFNLSIKDPLVRSSDEWQFPTNTLPTVGWLGRIHRGTPWQTIYLKASNVGLTNIVRSPTEWVGPAYRLSARKWAEWTGNKTLQEGFYTRPVSDRLLFDVFTTALNDNSARGRLPINQTNLAAWSAVFSGVTYVSNSLSEAQLKEGQQPQFAWNNIQPAGVYNPLDPTTWPPLVQMVNGINAMRANTNFFPNGVFASLGDVLAAPELTEASPFLNQSTDMAKTRGLTDAAYEWLPQQTLSLLQQGTPRFVIYAYGQALKPAPESIVTDGGGFLGLCTNYAITAEVGLRAVVRVEGSPNPAATNTFLPTSKRYPPHIVVESFNYLPPE